ncbi:hypothetical protein V8C86DRAFT_2753567, partial [Haematococcus lacustris]
MTWPPSAAGVMHTSAVLAVSQAARGSGAPWQSLGPGLLSVTSSRPAHAARQWCQWWCAGGVVPVCCVLCASDAQSTGPGVNRGSSQL